MAAMSTLLSVLNLLETIRKVVASMSSLLISKRHLLDNLASFYNSQFDLRKF